MKGVKNERFTLKLFKKIVAFKSWLKIKLIEMEHLVIAVHTIITVGAIIT
jgi:hypothetical protein